MLTQRACRFASPLRNHRNTSRGRPESRRAHRMPIAIHRSSNACARTGIGLHRRDMSLAICSRRQ
ncbi:hypothetical protein DF039_29310 [Burkholderia cenocepacia]|nr:hypothetical protein DF039_29310 [Burkholderia cenocepacia]